MTKIVYNACFGGFSLSYAAIIRYAKLKGLELYGFVNPGNDFNKKVPVDPAKANDEFCIYWRTKPVWDDEDSEWWDSRNLQRNDPALVQVVEELGAKANGNLANLVIAEIPEGQKYRIDEYDGTESVMTPEDYEWSIA